eukprot:scaffold1403_cov180-Ochromonas_danica.AAC.15
MAPEVITQSSYNGCADVWSTGITAIELAKGLPPYASKVHPMQVIFLIPKAPPPQLEGEFSSSFKSFVSQCLIKDPSMRPSAEVLLNHDFVCESKCSSEWVDFIQNKVIASRIASSVSQDYLKGSNSQDSNTAWNFNTSVSQGHLPLASSRGGGGGGSGTIGSTSGSKVHAIFLSSGQQSGTLSPSMSGINLGLSAAQHALLHHSPASSISGVISRGLPSPSATINYTNTTGGGGVPPLPPPSPGSRTNSSISSAGGGGSGGRSGGGGGVVGEKKQQQQQQVVTDDITPPKHAFNPATGAVSSSPQSDLSSSGAKRFKHFFQDDDEEDDNNDRGGGGGSVSKVSGASHSGSKKVFPNEYSTEKAKSKGHHHSHGHHSREGYESTSSLSFHGDVEDVNDVVVDCIPSHSSKSDTKQHHGHGHHDSHSHSNSRSDRPLLSQQQQQQQSSGGGRGGGSKKVLKSCEYYREQVKSLKKENAQLRALTSSFLTAINILTSATTSSSSSPSFSSLFANNHHAMATTATSASASGLSLPLLSSKQQQQQHHNFSTSSDHDHHHGSGSHSKSKRLMKKLSSKFSFLSQKQSFVSRDSGGVGGGGGGGDSTLDEFIFDSDIQSVLSVSSESSFNYDDDNDNDDPDPANANANAIVDYGYGDSDSEPEELKETSGSKVRGGGGGGRGRGGSVHSHQSTSSEDTADNNLYVTLTKYQQQKLTRSSILPEGLFDNNINDTNNNNNHDNSNNTNNSNDNSYMLGLPQDPLSSRAQHKAKDSGGGGNGQGGNEEKDNTTSQSSAKQHRRIQSVSLQQQQSQPLQPLPSISTAIMKSPASATARREGGGEKPASPLRRTKHMNVNESGTLSFGSLGSLSSHNRSAMLQAIHDDSNSSQGKGLNALLTSTPSSTPSNKMYNSDAPPPRFFAEEKEKTTDHNHHQPVQPVSLTSSGSSKQNQNKVNQPDVEAKDTAINSSGGGNSGKGNNNRSKGKLVVETEGIVCSVEPVVSTISQSQPPSTARSNVTSRYTEKYNDYLHFLVDHDTRHFESKHHHHHHHHHHNSDGGGRSGKMVLKSPANAVIRGQAIEQHQRSVYTDIVYPVLLEMKNRIANGCYGDDNKELSQSDATVAKQGQQNQALEELWLLLSISLSAIHTHNQEQQKVSKVSNMSNSNQAGRQKPMPDFLVDFIALLSAYTIEEVQEADSVIEHK